MLTESEKKLRQQLWMWFGSGTVELAWKQREEKVWNDLGDGTKEVGQNVKDGMRGSRKISAAVVKKARHVWACMGSSATWRPSLAIWRTTWLRTS